MTINVSNKLFYLLAGAAAGVLLAPKSGQEMRSTLTGKVDDLKNKIQDRVGSGTGEGVTSAVQDTVKNVVDRGKNVASIGRQRFNESIEAGKRKYNESLDSYDSGDDLDIASR
jgi:gas vesicle protein